MSENSEALLGIICFLASLAMIWIWASAVGERGIIETCDNYGSFVYEDVRYTCEKVEVVK